MRKYLCIAGCLFFMLIFIQGKVLAESNDVVAKIGDKKISISDLNKIIGYLDSERQKMFEKNLHLKEPLLRQLVQSMVISELAKKAGFDKRPEIKEQLEFFTNNFLANMFLKKEVADKVTVSEDDIKLYYDTHQDEFKKPEMVRARHILIKVDKSASEKDKKKAKKKTDDILKKIKAGEDFAKLASDLSDDAVSKSKGGDLGFFPRGRMVKSIEDAAFALKIGEVSKPFWSPLGLHIIKLEERIEGDGFDKVKDKIKETLFEKAFESKYLEWKAGLKEKAYIEIKL